MNQVASLPNDQGVKIGDAAKRLGLNVQTLRYYERLRLLVPKSRRASGYRIYGDWEIKRVHFIKRAQELGFSLNEIAELLNLRVSSETQCQNVRRRTEEKIAEVERKIAHLKAIHRVLKELVAACHARETTDRCPVLKSLEEE